MTGQLAEQRYVAGGRKRSSVRAARSRTAPRRMDASGKRTRDHHIVQLREWAGANDIAVPSRGRIAQLVLEQYKAAGGA